ncbi:MAG: hypothetical protein AAF590_04835 [Pseudomonadota bacterium]
MNTFLPTSINHLISRMVALVLATMSLVLASPALAHVRWFVDPNDPSLETFEGFSFTDPEVLVWIALAFTLIGASIALDTKLPKIKVVESKTRHDVMELVRIFVGMSFLLTAYDGAVVAPHLGAFGPLGMALLFLQAAIGIMLIANRFLKHASFLMLLLYGGMVVKFGFFGALEYCNIIGIALFLLFNNVSDSQQRERLKLYSVAALRIFTGVALVALAVGEKLQGALLGQAFMAAYNWNFMNEIGLDWFDDRLFVLSAGMMELTFGIILILGTTTRLTILALSAVMFLSNTVFLAQGAQEEAMVEFIGHLPLIATALILLFLGYGQRLKVTDLFTNRSRPVDPAPVAA